MDKTLVRQGVIQLELRLGKIHEAIKQTYSLEEFLRQSQNPVNVTLSVYSPLIGYYILLDNLDAARDALATATGMLQPPLDKFLAAAEALIQIKEDDFDGANASLGRTGEVIEQFQVKFLEVQIHLVRAKIGEEQGEYASVTDEYLQSLDLIEQTVIAGGLQTIMPRVYSQLAIAQIQTGDLDAAEQSIEAGYRLDQSEPMLWVAKARLQRARNIPRLALASVNYALAIWEGADEDYIRAKSAIALASELQNTGH